MLDGDADTEGVNQALARVLAWPDLARSPQLSNFLTYIVERRLGGDAQSIKAYTIAVDVFGRAPDFDPQADPIVRVQARRLRGLLDQYYRGPGADDPLRIQLPIGRYVPDFIDSATEPSARPIGREPSVVPDSVPHARPRGHVTISWFVLLVLALGATAMAYSLATWGERRELAGEAGGAIQPPHLRIMEFRNLTGDTGLTPRIAALAVELVTDFSPVVMVEAAFGGRGTVGVDTDQRVDFVLSGVVREAPASQGYEFNAILTDSVANSVVWNWSKTVPRAEIMGGEGVDSLSRELISRMGNPRGPLHARARALLDKADIAGQENVYLCELLFAAYRASPTPGAVARLEACIRALPEASLTSADILAARASILAELNMGGHWNSEEQLARYADARTMLEQALRKAPTSSFVWEQQARLYEATGEHDDAQAAYSTALQLNTANIDAAAASARHMSLIGQLAEAIPIAQRAIDAVPALEVPDWYFCVPAMAALVDNAFQQSERWALRCGRVDAGLGSILVLLAAEGANDVSMIGQALSGILEVPDFRTSGIMTRLERRITDPVLLDQAENALRKAGVPERSLFGPY